MPKTNLSESFKKLSAIADWFDSRSDIDLEEGLKKIKEGAGLIKESRVRLKEVENEFEEIKKELDQGFDDGE